MWPDTLVKIAHPSDPTLVDVAFGATLQVDLMDDDELVLISLFFTGCIPSVLVTLDAFCACDDVANTFRPSQYYPSQPPPILLNAASFVYEPFAYNALVALGV